MRAVSKLVLTLVAALCFSAVSAQLSVRVAAPTSYDITTRFLETIYHEKPDAFFPFLRQLQQYQVRPKVTYSDPAFRSSKTLEGKPRPSKYQNHNPVFTTLAKPWEVYQALESTFLRSRLWRARGAPLIWKTALANHVALPVLEQMEEVWKARESKVQGHGKQCQSWIDLAGSKACTSEEFWKTVGLKQIFAHGPLTVPGEAPELHSFDRLLPAARNESLPLVVLYAAATDEVFPALFDLLYKLAQPAAGSPRLQFALRWKPNTDVSLSSLVSRFDSQAKLAASAQVDLPTDLSARASAYVQQSQDKLSSISSIASSLPTLAHELAALKVDQDVTPNNVEENNFVTLNNVCISDENGLDIEKLLSAMRTDSDILQQLTSLIHVDERVAYSILLNSTITLEAPRSTSKGIIVPTQDHPLRFVNLVDAIKDLPYLVTRGSFIEGLTDEQNEIDPPALASIYLIADLESTRGRQQVKEALKFLETATRVRLAFLHRPAEVLAESEATKSPYAFSSLLYSLAASKQLAETYPHELSEYLELEIGENGPKRSLGDAWTKDNPITPFLDGGLAAQDSEASATYFSGVRQFVSRMGVEEGQNALVINGRIIRLGNEIISSSSMKNLLQYELEQRIRSVAQAATPSLPEKLAQDRVLQADLFNLASSVLSASNIDRSSKYLFPSSEPVVHVAQPDVVPMFELSAVLDPVSPFARKVLPILTTLAKEGLFTLNVHLAPTTSVPSSIDGATYYRSSFATRLQFDEEETFEEIGSNVEFDQFKHGSQVEVEVIVNGKPLEPKQHVVVTGDKQELVFTTNGRDGEKRKEIRDRTEL
ncbi:uncharacterized protein JCM15063_002684 [Sporobolomyces koalae]|uniref:uncharacterized protein n=1 Tax=Sporobolomyces koalae TaxID=500713 RepID=UPI00317BB9D0